MSSSWTERQGQVGDLRKQSREELQELLLRQEKILSNKRLIQTLPDKGKKITEFAEKIRLAIEHHNEEDKRQSLVSAARTELQSKYQQAFTMQQRGIPFTPASSGQNTQSDTAAGDAMQERETYPVSAHVHQSTTFVKQQDQFVSRLTAGETMVTAAAGTSLNSDQTKEGDLVEALERVRLSETSIGFSNEFKNPLNSTVKDNYFLRKETTEKPYHVTVLEKSERTSAPRKQTFKPNQLHKRNDVSPSESNGSPNLSSRGLSPLTAQARREQDRKHLDDITAAKLPPLHHNPAQLLSLEQSAILLKEQMKKQEELQAKLAAQKLSEGLKVSMGSYIPDGGPMAAYREVHDEGAQLSSEED